MALSQCLDDSPGPRIFRRGGDLHVQQLYDERHRLALEVLIADGLQPFLSFLEKEKMPNFLSDAEIRYISSAAVVPRCASLEDLGPEHSVSGSMDCSSVTYFPDVSDVEPPLLELGWPGFTTGSFRGVTRAVAHFQPSYGECIYSCKEAARKMIKSAKEVIAVVTDSLTDADIFRDLQEACTQRRVPVYILLDRACVPAFLQMCGNLDICLDDLQLMRVRTITGATYFLRSGAKLTGQVHERFMLIDGNRVATGSYRFTWTDGKLNSSNLIELSGQISEKFDEEFRILYAQSLPLASYPHTLPDTKNRIKSDSLIQKKVPPPSPLMPALQLARAASTPSRAPPAGAAPPSSPGSGQESPASDISTIGEDWMEQAHMRDVLGGAGLAAGVELAFAAPTCHVATQTDFSTEERCSQTAQEAQPDPAAPEPTSLPLTHPGSPPHRLTICPPIPRCSPPGGHLRDCFLKLTKERQYHYSAIRSKLDHMVALLAQRRELGDLTNLNVGPGLLRVCKEPVRGPVADGLLMSPWPKARCLH
ncbi:protein FAM83D [Paramormyrops kingsleyae]|uniref:Family with sequence similarity 83 member D n=1 Tax=Paramormyrops kingsleyae TaxID=1676925 RepID=A0A3B3RTW7_9TELE|nr:protein FAM83D-like [Paramormyrops kingsleyae]